MKRTAKPGTRARHDIHSTMRGSVCVSNGPRSNSQRVETEDAPATTRRVPQLPREDKQDKSPARKTTRLPIETGEGDETGGTSSWRKSLTRVYRAVTAVLSTVI